MELETRRKRLTREESRQQTRDRLLEAAHELFIQDGIENTPIERIAEHAGYSRGAFYSNFETKEDVLWALLDRETERVRIDLNRMVELGMPAADRMRALRDYVRQYSRDRSHCLFELDCDMFAIRHPQHRERMAAYLQRDREIAAGFIRGIFEELGVTGKDPDLIVGMFIAMAQGMTMQEITAPGSFSTNRVEAAVQLFFDAVFGPAIEGCEPDRTLESRPSSIPQ